MTQDAQQDEVARCLRGEKLYGDDFSPSEIEAWFEEEKEGYYQLHPRDSESYRYAYDALNWIHGFSRLPSARFRHVLGVGAAYGDELRQIASRIDRVTILECSQSFWSPKLDGVSVDYAMPSPSGQFPFAKESFDLMTSFGTLHHIPNVTTIVREMYRCLKPGGFALVREPIISMGDWRRPRRGLTRRERGIPLPILHRIIDEVGFRIQRERKCMFSLTSRLNYVLRSPVYNHPFLTYLDAMICRLPVWANRYHPTQMCHRLRPWAIFLILQRPET